MSAVEYTVKRNVPASNGAGADCRIAVVFIRHESRFIQTLAINEELIRMEAGGEPERERRFIEQEIALAAAR